MRANDLKSKKLPDTPGVYFFRDARGKILYIGKATSLRDRVRSYFNRDLIDTRSPAIAQMVHEAVRVDVEQADSVLEALILEANLIKKHKPRYNTREKDDKSFNYVVITREAYPRVMVVRGRELGEKFPASTRMYLFGPFPSGALFREAMRLIRKLFPYYDTPFPVDEMRSKSRAGKLRFNRALGLYPSPDITKREYARTIQHIKLFLEGRKSELIRRLEREMRAYASAEEFEKAQSLKRVLFALTHIQDVSLLKREIRDLAARRGARIEAYDVAHTSGKDTVGVMVVVEGGETKKQDYRKFRIKEAAAGSDTGALAEVLTRRFSHDEWILPDLIVVDGGRAQMNTALRALKAHGYAIPIVAVVKGEGHRPQQLLGDRAWIVDHESAIVLANSEAHRFAVSYHRKVRGRR